MAASAIGICKKHDDLPYSAHRLSARLTIVKMLNRGSSGWLDRLCSGLLAWVRAPAQTSLVNIADLYLVLTYIQVLDLSLVFTI